MGQTKLNSFIEQLLNIGSGFLLSLFIWAYVIAPLYNIEVVAHQNFQIVGIFTIVSIVRGYIWRRLFNWINHGKRR